MASWKPLRRHDVLVRRSGSRTTVQDAVARRAHSLNETAEFIWQRCDGKHTEEQLQVLLRAAFDVPPDIDLKQDVSRTVSALQSRRLLVPEGH